MESEAVNPTGNNVTSRDDSSRFSTSARRRRPLRWRLIPAFVAVLVLVPIGTVISSFFAPATDVWQHLIETTLPGLLINTFWLVMGVACGVLLLGVSLAWLTAVCEFPGRRFLSWALLLPLAVPAYVTAFVALGLFDYVGPVQTMLRAWLGSNLPWFPDIRSRMGVIVVMVLAFYPYVYLLARNAFLTQGKRSLEAAQSLGLNRAQGFFKVAFPMARPWIAGGLMLRADGNAGGFRHSGGVQLRHVHHRNLQSLVRYVFIIRSFSARVPADCDRVRGDHHRTAGSFPHTLRGNPTWRTG